MEHESHEYTQHPAAQAQRMRAKSRVPSASVGAAAAAVVIAAFFAAGPLLFPKKGPVSAPKAAPAVPVLEKSAPVAASIETGQDRRQSSLPIALEPKEQVEPAPAETAVPPVPEAPSARPASSPSDWTAWRQISLTPCEADCGLRAGSDVNLPISVVFRTRSGIEHLYEVRNGLPWRARLILSSPGGETWDLDVPAGGSAVLRGRGAVAGLTGQVWAWVAAEETYGQVHVQ